PAEGADNQEEDGLSPDFGLCGVSDQSDGQGIDDVIEEENHLPGEIPPDEAKTAFDEGDQGAQVIHRLDRPVHPPIPFRYIGKRLPPSWMVRGVVSALPECPGRSAIPC